MEFVLIAILYGFIFIGSTVAVAFSAYFAMRWLAAAHVDERTESLAGSVIFRIGALHGLILALVFAQQMIDHNHVRDAMNREASIIEDVFFDLGRYDAEKTLETRKMLARYTHAVVHEEWQSLAAENQLSHKAWREWDIVYQQLLDLEPVGRRQEILQTTMVTKIQQVASLRQTRGSDAEAGPADNLFWIAAIIGVILVSATYFTFEPTRLNLFLLVAFAVYTGLILALIASVGDPYNPPGALSPLAFERLLVGEMANFYDGS